MSQMSSNSEKVRKHLFSSSHHTGRLINTRTQTHTRANLTKKFTKDQRRKNIYILHEIMSLFLETLWQDLWHYFHDIKAHFPLNYHYCNAPGAFE